MENCLVTKLKAVVTSDNLPTLDTIILDDFVANLPASPKLLIMPGNTSVKIVCKVPMYSSTSYNDGVMEMTITNTKIIQFKKSEIEALTSKKDFLKITGGIYNIKKLGDSNFLTLNALLKSGLLAQEYNQNLICFGCNTIMNDPVKSLSASIEFINIGKVYDEWFTAPYALKYILGGTFSGSFEIPLNDATRNNNTVRVMSWLNGDIQNVPKNIVRCNLVYNTNGSIEELVASMIDRGRTSGSIKFTIASATNVTYNGVRLGQLYNSAKILVWNNDTITWQDEETEEIAAYPFYTMYSYPVS